jgi:hypothetical protein
VNKTKTTALSLAISGKDTEGQRMISFRGRWSKLDSVQARRKLPLGTSRARVSSWPAAAAARAAPGLTQANFRTIIDKVSDVNDSAFSVLTGGF